MQCKYKKQDGSKCNREAIADRSFCLLHEDWNHKNEEETRKEFFREIDDGISDFEGCILPEVDLSEREFEGDLNFRNARIKVGASLNTAKIKGDVYFEGATVDGAVFFEDATIKGNACFSSATIGAVLCDGAIIEKNASFDGTIIDGVASFRETTIKGCAQFWRVTIEGDALFEGAIIKESAWFEEATINGYAQFNGATIEDASFLLANISLLTFEDATFYNVKAQEVACREAKITQERRGNRELADYHFYREMEAKRKQKRPVIRFLELPVQYIFGYGVHPFWVIGAWLLIVFILAFVYWIGNGIEAADSLWEYIYFSVVTAATPGYGGYHPKPGFYQGLASFEAIFGTFMWAAFIATFARKYMR